MKINFNILSLLKKLAPDMIKIKNWVDGIIRKNPDLTQEQIANIISNHYINVSTTQGAALALPGSIPGLGTIIETAIDAGAIGVDITLFMANQISLVFALGYLYGIEERELLIQETLIIIGLSSGALEITKSGAIRIGTKIVTKQFDKKFSAKILMAINKKVGTTVLTKYGTKRGGIALGRLIPFGVGVMVGGLFNHFTMKAFAKYAKMNMSLKYNTNPNPNPPSEGTAGVVCV